MSRKVWNWIYLTGLLLPVFIYFGSFITVALSDGSSPLIVSTVWDNLVSFCSVQSVSRLLPVSQVATAIVRNSYFFDNVNAFISRAPVVSCWTIGADFVIWLSIIHIVIDLFMLLSRCLSRLFAKFGGAD